MGLSIGGGVRRSDSTVLIFRIGSLGDTIVALPCFHQIARAFPESRRIVITDRPGSEKATPLESVLQGSGLIDEVIYFPPPPRRLADFLALRASIRRTGATKLLYIADRKLLATIRDDFFLRSCGIRHVIGAPIRRDLRRLRLDPKNGDTEREAERLARCLGPLGHIDVNDPAMWDLRLQTPELRAADAALAPLHDRDFIAVSLGGKDSAKDWGDANWVALLGGMSERLSGLALVFIGSADEFKRCAAIAAGWGGPTVNLCGRMTVRESAAAMRRARFFLGHDCGPMHLAAAVGIPCVAIFGAVNMPKWWYPIGSHHRIVHNRYDIRGVGPGEVLGAVDAMIAAIPNRLSRQIATVTA